MSSHRPWGYYVCIDRSTNDTEYTNSTQYQVKKIVVFPNKRLSLQYHNHRTENWVVVQGSGVAQVGDDIISIKDGESVFIDKKVVHRITNNGTENLIFIETQCGSYLGEDDIVRLEDDYGRV